MKAPEKIYVTPVRTWDTKHIPDLQDNIYISKDALLEWAENWKKLGQNDDFMYAIETLILHLNSM